MNILPTLADVREIASDGAYKVIPVSCEILSDFITPVEAIKILKKCIYALLYAGICAGK